MTEHPRSASRNTSNGMHFEPKLDWFGKTERPASGIFDGSVTALQLQPGFGLHTLNATANQSYVIDGQRKPGTVLHCFLEGSTAARLDNRPMNLGHTSGGAVKLVLTSIEETQRFWRRSDPGEYVRKISIQMSPNWLEGNGLCVPIATPTGAMQRHEWYASPQEIKMLEALASTPRFSSPVTRLHAESMALALVAESFERFSDQSTNSTLSKRETIQLSRIEALARRPGPVPSLAALATEAGLSQSGLRRLIQSVYGRAPLAHIRALRLEMAYIALKRDHISIEDAAAMAGYTSGANFATAFRRAYKVPPSQIRGGH
ncbi:helix-turn-helix domain-containing protein [Shimia sp.]|uniref:helix-turn-helix domain-containing protein n=1 Tax=Shimia sp. TaxID=1954381 RepID=UPI003BAD1276